MYVCHKSVEALLPLLWSQFGVRAQIPHDIEVRSHLVGQTCHTKIILISSNFTDHAISLVDGKTSATAQIPATNQGRTEMLSPCL